MMIKLLLIDLINFFTSFGETTYQKIKQLANECRYAPLQQTWSPEFPRAEQFIFAKKGRLYIVWMLERLYHHCLHTEFYLYSTRS